MDNKTTRIPRPCKHGGCMRLTTEGYCELHKADANPMRQSPSARGYNYKWQKASKAYLAKHPFCAECERQGLHVLATEVDHIIPHKGDKVLFWNKDNWQGLCHSCHSRKTVRENGGFGSRY